MTCSCVKKKNSTLNGLPQGDGGARDRQAEEGRETLTLQLFPRLPKAPSSAFSEWLSVSFGAHHFLSRSLLRIIIFSSTFCDSSIEAATPFLSVCCIFTLKNQINRKKIISRKNGKRHRQAIRNSTKKTNCEIHMPNKYFLNANFAVARGLEVEFVRRYGDILPLICQLTKMN